MPTETSIQKIFLTRRGLIAMAGGIGFAAIACRGRPDDHSIATSQWAQTSGGDTGRTVRVTTLAVDGPGSLAEACRIDEPRKIVFDVGGVIDLERTTLEIPVPYVTIAGETAPEPGITLIRGGVIVKADHAVVRHLRVRPGSAGFARGSGWHCDCINVYASKHVIVDHCSLSWGTDENLSASGPPFDGDTPAEWRRNTSSRIVFSNNLIAEGLAHSTHSEGEHSKGSLVHSNVTDVLFFRNMFASNRQRNPLFNGGTSGAIINNLIFNPGTRAIMLSALPEHWQGREMVPGRLAIIGNILERGPSSLPGVAMVSATPTGLWHLYQKDNQVWNDGFLPDSLIAPHGPNLQLIPEDPYFRYPAILPSTLVRETVWRDVGARPWSRDPIDQRVVSEAEKGRGALIDSEENVGGYPRNAQ